MTEKEIIKLYLESHSMHKVSLETGISEQTVRRILITAGMYSCGRVSEIMALRQYGLSIDEIAERLHMARTSVIAYTPYSKGPYAIGEKTKNAQKIKAWRDSKLNSET